VSLVYEAFCWLVRLVVLRGRRDRSKDVELLVLRKELEVLRRQAPRPQLGDRDRVVLAALSRVLPRTRWSVFVVSQSRWLTDPRRKPSAAAPRLDPVESPAEPGRAGTTRSSDALPTLAAITEPHGAAARMHLEVARAITHASAASTRSHTAPRGANVLGLRRTLANLREQRTIPETRGGSVCGPGAEAKERTRGTSLYAVLRTCGLMATQGGAACRG